MKEYKKILIECLHGIGDAVCLLPTLDLVKQNYPNSDIDVLVKSNAAMEVLKLSSVKVNRIIVIDFYKEFKNSIRCIKKLRQEKYDLGISSSFTPIIKAKLFMQVIHPKEWIGLQKYNLCYNKVEDRFHFVEANIEAVKPICECIDEVCSPRIYPHRKDVEFIKNVITNSSDYIADYKTVGICVGDADYSYKNKWLRCGKVHTRGWGIENIIALLYELKNMKLNIILIGGKNELIQYNRIIDDLGEKGYTSFVGKTNIAQSAALVSLCDCVVGVDTGMQHIADAVGVKTLSIFGPTNPKTHGAYSEKASFIEKNISCKYCYGTTSYTHCVNRRCLNEIQVNDVVKKLLEIINYQ